MIIRSSLYFQSDAEVTRQGVTDRATIEAQLGIQCGGDATCEANRDAIVDNFIAQNTNGTARSLGGDTRLRGYPGGRYQGGHARAYGFEFRWNLSEEVTPFDYWIWKDTRTGTQVAFFWETGTVAETKEELGDIYRTGYGVGYRLVTASGFVYRAEIANGYEGSTTIIIFDYPW